MCWSCASHAATLRPDSIVSIRSEGNPESPQNLPLFARHHSAVIPGQVTRCLSVVEQVLCESCSSAGKFVSRISLRSTINKRLPGFFIPPRGHGRAHVRSERAVKVTTCFYKSAPVRVRAVYNGIKN